jgi:hypothetical protein
MNEKKEYSTPSVTVYGRVEEITRQGGLENADVPGGDPGTAYSPS